MTNIRLHHMVGIASVVALLCGFQPAACADPIQVRCLAFSPDGQLLGASGSTSVTNGKLIVWETKTWKPVLTLEDADVGYSRAAFSPDGKTLAMCQFAPTLKLINVATGKVARELVGHEGHVRAVAYTPDGQTIITGGYDMTVRLWSAAAGDAIKTLATMKSPVFHVAVSPDGTRLAVADRKGAAELWDLESHRQLRRFEGLGSLVPHVGFSPDSSVFTACSWSEDLTLFDTKTFQRLNRIDRIGGVHWSEFSPDSKWFAVASNASSIHLFPGRTQPDDIARQQIGKLIARWNDESYDVREQASAELLKFGLASTEQLIAALKSPNAEVRVRARQARRKLATPDSAVPLKGHPGEPECVRFSPDSKLLATGDDHGVIKLWRVGDWTELRTLKMAD